MSAEQVYPYRAKPTTMILGAVFFGAAGALMLHQAQTNTRALLINGLIRLDPSEATVFYYVFGVLGLLFVPLAIFSLYASFTKKPTLTLGPSSITVPPGALKGQTRTVAYADIQAIQHNKVNRQEFLKITPRGGKTITIAASLLPSKAVCATIRGELAARAKAAQAR